MQDGILYLLQPSSLNMYSTMTASLFKDSTLSFGKWVRVYTVFAAG
jgi:hypothetical protein